MGLGFLYHRDDRVAIIEAESGESITHAHLIEAVERRIGELREYGRSVAFLGIRPTIATVVDILAMVELEITTALIDPGLDSSIFGAWIDTYRPELVFGLGRDDRADDPAGGDASAEPRDTILLATSGSTGNPKFVRLSQDNLASNARQIAAALRIDASHRAFGHLPLFYSYGLSILTSHLLVGASVVLTGVSAIRPEFWQALKDHEVTSLPGVPYHFEMYRRMKLTERDLPHLRDVTQAGGRLNPERIREFHHGLSKRGVRLWIMYGQTEATARISVLPADELEGHIGSVGYPLPGGTIEIDDPDDTGAGEIVYCGPNVMLGYAEARADLNIGDTLTGRLPTGDIGRLDADGRLWVTGRSKRIAKVVGVRVNLDDIELRLATTGLTLAVVDSERGITVFYEADAEIDGLAKTCQRLLNLPPRTVDIIRVDRLPTTTAGKISYQDLTP